MNSAGRAINSGVTEPAGTYLADERRRRHRMWAAMLFVIGRILLMGMQDVDG